MKTEVIDVSTERQILIGMIMSTSFLKRIIPIFEYEYFELPTSKTVAKWVIKYVNKYDKAPKAIIRDIYERQERKLKEAESEWIELFLSDLSSEYKKEGFNTLYLFDVATNYFRKQKLLSNARVVQDLCEDEKLDEAEAIWKSSMHISDTMDLGVNPFDEDTVFEYTKKDTRFIVRTGVQAFDRLAGPLKSEWLVMFMGPMKRGKTQALTHCGIESTARSFNTVFYSLESGYKDLLERMWMNVGSLSTSRSEIEFPYFKDKRKELVSYKKIKRPVVKNLDNVLKAVKKYNRIAKGTLWVKSFPAFSAGVEDIKHHLDLLMVYKKFIPHVIIVDYLGAMKPAKGVFGRDVYDYGSKSLKGLAQERKALVFSAHQGSRSTLDKLNMHPTDIPEDVRILGNLDVLIGLNQTEKEKEENIMRWNILMHRFKKFTRLKQAKVLYQPEAGQFHLDSMIINTPKAKPKNKLVGMKDSDSD